MGWTASSSPAGRSRLGACASTRRGLKFKDGVKRQDRVNARVRYIEGDMEEAEYQQWAKNFDNVPEPLLVQEKSDFLAALSDISIASDAFFPFRDSIDHAQKLGVKFIAQPGGSNADEEVIKACDTYGMTMAFTDVRLFHHLGGRRASGARHSSALLRAEAPASHVSARHQQ